MGTVLVQLHGEHLRKIHSFGSWSKKGPNEASLRALERTKVHEEGSTKDPDAIMLKRYTQGLTNLEKGYQKKPRVRQLHH